MIAAADFERVAERWLSEFDTREDGFQALEVATGIAADGWRKRLSHGESYTRKGTPTTHGWYAMGTLSPERVDEFLTAADATHLWVELGGFEKPGEWISARVRLGREPRVKRLSKASRLSRSQVFAIHKLHVEGGHSLRKIARAGWETWGYANERACVNCICDLLKSFGLRTRSREEATALANRERGMRLPGETKAEFRRRRRLEVRDWHCAGHRLQYPRKGERCGLAALSDSEFCRFHDPRYREVVVAEAARARAGFAVRT